MSNFTFACASVNGLTLAQKRETIKALRESIKSEVASRKAARETAKSQKALAKTARAAVKAEKAEERAAKKAAKIIALEAKLNALKNPVGTAARKANKKPSKVSVTKVAVAA